jgi:ribosome-binding ATPase YchF (GTP1/OBG family)
LGVEDSPQNSKCVDGERFIPVDLVDLPGLVPGAWEGRGLGNQFLDEVRKADALIHVLDASGSTDAEGKLTSPGGHDPLEDVRFLERELEMWMFQILNREWEKIARRADMTGEELAEAVTERLSGLGVRQHQVEEALRMTGPRTKPSEWSKEDLIRVVAVLRKASKPALLAANKIDLPSSPGNVDRFRRTNELTVPVCAEAELALRRAAEKGLIHYSPGDARFTIAPGADLSPQQRTALEMIEQRVLEPFGTTGIQECINSAFFRLLNMIVVYPVEDPDRLTDHSGNVLPDAFLVPTGTTLKELAGRIHTELSEQLLYGVNARSGMRLGDSYVLKDGDVVSIVSTAQRR